MFGAGSPVTTSTTINVVGTRVCAIDVHPETAIAQAASAVKLRMLRIECVKCFIGDKKKRPPHCAEAVEFLSCIRVSQSC